MSDILQQLIDLSRYLGDPDKPYAILGEGNTSARVDEDSFYVKASGTSLVTIDANGFVLVSKSAMLNLLDDASANDDDVTSALKDALIDKKERRRPSVETMLHALLLDIPEYAFVGHTHPVYTNMLLCSKVAEEAFSHRIFPDQIVSMGHRNVFVPYVDPGLPLAREVKRRLDRFIEEEGMLPKAIVMQNHGFIAMGDSPKAVSSCTDMSEKASQILVGAYAIGGPNWMRPQDVDRIFTRPDEHYRLKSIAGGGSNK